MLRPLLAFATLCAAVFVLAPTIQSQHERVESLQIHREFPWQLFKWDDKKNPPPNGPVGCERSNRTTEVNVTDWPERIEKDKEFTLKGYVRSVEDKGKGVSEVSVQLFLNATKEKPGELLAVAETDGAGNFRTQTLVPHDLVATHYHIVAHALEKEKACVIYGESWSDPETDVTSTTHLDLDVPPRAVVGRNVTVRGKLTDAVGAAVPNAEVELKLFKKPVRVVTDGQGAFAFNTTAVLGTDPMVTARYDGDKYYGKSNATARLDVVPEDVQIDGETLILVRGAAKDVTGRVILPPNATMSPFTLSFSGIRVQTCATCPLVGNVTVDPAPDGTFSLTVIAPSTERAGAFNMTARGGGLRGAVALEGALRVPVIVTLDASGDGFLSKGYGGTATALNDRREPATGVLAVSAPAGWTSGKPDKAGMVAFSGASSCGVHDVRAFYNGTQDEVPAEARASMGVCGFFAYLPSWMLAIPWWGWVLGVLGALAIATTIRHLLTRYAPTLSRGPPLTLRITEPSDGGEDVAGLGEAVRAVAFLEDPLPEGHVLRLGERRDMTPFAVGDDLRASRDLVPEALGDLVIRAEITDPRGRVVTRRTARLRIVRYAEEIEKRYRELKRSAVGEHGDTVTPRSFETWLRERSPHLDPIVARHLVGIFEEADYSPRDAGRREYLAYLEAERAAAPEVVAPAR